MKLYLKRISLLFLSLTFLLGACDTEESLTVIAPEAAFVLNTPGISSVFLNFALPDNAAFTVTWKDEVTGASSYNVEMSMDDAFSSPVQLGATETDNFSMTVASFNEAISSTGINNFRDVAIYLRVNTGSQVSNTVLLLVTTYPENAPVITGISEGDAFVLSLVNNNKNAVTIGWDDPILKSSLGINIDYILEAAAPGTDFASPIEAGTISNQSAISFTNAKLNGIAFQSGIPVDTAGDMQFRVRSTITDVPSGSVLERISEPVTINVTTYLTVLDLSTNWGIVGSAANDWGATPDLPFFTTDVDGVLAAYVTLIDGEIKFRENSDWANNLGSDSSTGGNLVQGGGNLSVTAGAYKIVMDLNNMSYTIESFSIGIVGGAYNEWGATPDFKLEYDQYSNVFRGIVTLIDGEMKFRMNNDWGLNYGDNGADGSLEDGGANLAVNAGIYIATVNLNELSYTLEPITNVWGVVGGAYNEWGASPDAQFKRDWSRPFNDIWIVKDVPLIDGEYKFRANNDWGTNYGDNGSDGILELNGANLVAVAGTYSFELDFSDPDNPTYTIN
jgi:hypothetical protein